ncbi:MAG: hypothetical protein AB1631_06520 [Acidobacteriota bacterium]
MKSSDLMMTNRAKNFCRIFALTLFAVILSSFAFAAQQQSQPKKKAPTLTTDDVIKPKPEQIIEEGAAAPEKVEGKKTEAAAVQAGKTKDNAEESSWRDRVTKARQRAKEAERIAEETELRITDLRNQLGFSGQTTQQRNATAVELEETGKRLIELRAEARTAAADLEKLLEYGREKGFAEAAGPSATTEEGKPNEDYYRSRHQKLLDELRTAERRVDLYENRVRELNQRIRANSGSGDNFYIAQLSQDRDEAQQKLNEAQEARNKARKELDDLFEEARRAGVPPGVFRQN